jgi:hypothetical protein
VLRIILIDDKSLQNKLYLISDSVVNKKTCYWLIEFCSSINLVVSFWSVWYNPCCLNKLPGKGEMDLTFGVYPAVAIPHKLGLKVGASKAIPSYSLSCVHNMERRF